MPWRPMLILPLNGSRSTRGHNLYTHINTCVIDASCQVLLKSVHRGPVPEKKNFEGSLPYMGMVAILGHVTWIIYIHWFPLPINDS